MKCFWSIGFLIVIASFAGVASGQSVEKPGQKHFARGQVLIQSNCVDCTGGGRSGIGPAPCAGGNCNNGPAGSDTVVDTSGLSADQQFEAGLFCGSIHPVLPTPGNSVGIPISSTLGANLCPASQYGSSLLQIPSPGTENDDHNPPRVAPRNLFDVALGDDNLFKGERYKWSLTLTAVNITNKTALYNFLSTFSGTHYVTPRALTAQIGFHF
jgi:hypothetical protein